MTNEAREQILREYKDVLDVARETISDAICCEDGLDGGTGEAVIKWITDLLGDKDEFYKAHCDATPEDVIEAKHKEVDSKVSQHFRPQLTLISPEEVKGILRNCVYNYTGEHFDKQDMLAVVLDIDNAAYQICQLFSRPELTLISPEEIRKAITDGFDIPCTISRRDRKVAQAQLDHDREG